ncbi:hypothetical protein AB4114_02285 [Paenibacillus sp. 2RAB27]|uniref:hypothetical protein n=1 Tax=Paenibacillus sp. 2RAB27 TaxID=3232991 RepID=UPI003F96274F
MKGLRGIAEALFHGQAISNFKMELMMKVTTSCPKVQDGWMLTLAMFLPQIDGFYPVAEVRLNIK